MSLANLNLTCHSRLIVNVCVFFKVIDFLYFSKGDLIILHGGFKFTLALDADVLKFH